MLLHKFTSNASIMSNFPSICQFPAIPNKTRTTTNTKPPRRTQAPPAPPTPPPPPKQAPKAMPPPTDRRQPPEDICQNRHPKPNSQAQCPISLSLIEDSYRKAFTKTNILNPIPHKVVAHKIKSVTAI